MDQLDHQGTIDMNLFMKSAAPKYLQVLYLHGGEFPLMDTYKEGLGFLLQSVHLQIYIFKFSLKESGVRTIFENCINAQDVVLRGCQIAEIRDAFKLDDTQSYHLETLNFYWTYPKYVTKENLTTILKSLARTQLAKSLKTFKVCSNTEGEEDNEKERKEIQSIMDREGFKAQVCVSWESPKEI